MRSVHVYLKNVDQATVAEALDLVCNGGSAPQWLWLKDDDAVLYVEFFDYYGDYEPEEWRRLTRKLGCEPSVSIVADVSGRHDGRREVPAFVRSLLERFPGVVGDDYEFYWTFREVLSEKKQGGRTFFDIKVL
ncbi:hypothetical protein ACFL2Q_02540 [Thermodesulfobacteriota bacterium]